MPESEVLPLFPSFLWKAHFPKEERRPMDRALLAKLAERRLQQPPLETGDGWQSEPNLHRAEELGELLDRVRAEAERALAFLKVAEGGLAVTGCWANISAPEAGHKRHHHPNNFLSGVYYLRTQPGADTVNFHDPRPAAGALRPPVTELTGYNTDLTVVQVVPGDLLLFPAWLEHSVDPNRSREERISLSLNLMFPGFAERMAAPLWDGGTRRHGE